MKNISIVHVDLQIRDKPDFDEYNLQHVLNILQCQLIFDEI